MPTRKQAAARRKFARLAKAKGNSKIGRRAKSSARQRKKRYDRQRAVLPVTVRAALGRLGSFIRLGGQVVSRRRQRPGVFDHYAYLKSGFPGC